MEQAQILVKKCIFCEEEHTEFCVCNSDSSKSSIEDQCEYCKCCWEHLYPNF